jgi:hypothetical protein
VLLSLVVREMICPLIFRFESRLPICFPLLFGMNSVSIQLDTGSAFDVEVQSNESPFLYLSFTYFGPILSSKYTARFFNGFYTII